MLDPAYDGAGRTVLCQMGVLEARQGRLDGQVKGDLVSSHDFWHVNGGTPCD